MRLQQFLKDHLYRDMTALEVARYFGVDPALVYHEAEMMGLQRPAGGQPTAFHSPYPPVVAVGVKKYRRDDRENP
jgi:hypothetical protein